jgi:hypothetical protein
MNITYPFVSRSIYSPLWIKSKVRLSFRLDLSMFSFPPTWETFKTSPYIFFRLCLDVCIARLDIAFGVISIS